MKKFWRGLFLTQRFFILFGSVAAVFIISFGVPVIFPVAQGLLYAGIALTLGDFILSYSKQVRLTARRSLPKIFSLGSDNSVEIKIVNESDLGLQVQLVDEVPVQFEMRDFVVSFFLKPEETKYVSYLLRPLTRGEYSFGKINLLVSTRVGLILRKHETEAEFMVPVYPSVLMMKQFELKSIAKISSFYGIKKIRRLGHSYEFEQIKNYVKGDDYRSINWKATSRKGELMVNQFEDEKAQQIYSVIDLSRNMKMPFEGLSLLDHAINTGLVISNIALKKQDKAGLITFSEKVDSVIRADRGAGQLRRIMEALYRQKERPAESNYEFLYNAVRNTVKGRSLIFLYTNFESHYALERVLPLLRKINQLHLLVVVFFENSEVVNYSREEAKDMEEIYLHTIAGKFMAEKMQIVYTLRQFGIQSILTPPEHLALNSVNKYLELKARGLI